MDSTRSETENDPFELRRLYHHLRVVDVCDALDGIGYFDIGLMSPEVRPLWPGMKFWGVAFTIRCVPANRPRKIFCRPPIPCRAPIHVRKRSPSIGRSRRRPPDSPS